MKTTPSDKFNLFVFSIDDTLAELRTETGLGEAGLDFSVESLDRLERWLSNQNMTLSHVRTINMVAQYLGEYMRLHHGGHWVLGEDENSTMTHDIPLIISHNDRGNPFSPISVVENFVVHKDSGLFRDAIDAEFDDFDFDLKPE